MRRLERDYVAADLAAVEELLTEVPDEDVLGRRTLTARREALATQLAALEGPDPSAHAALTFGGVPVFGSRGIDAKFAANAVEKFGDFVTRVWGGRQHGQLANMGPIPDREEARLHITGTMRGSFGFKLEELGGTLHMDEAPLRDAVELAAHAIAAAADSDEALADAVEAFDLRAYAALGTFLDVLRKHRATFRLTTQHVDEQFDTARVSDAAERASTRDFRVGDVVVDGEFLGVLPDSRKFEFRLLEGRVIKGKVSDEMPMTLLREMNPRFASKRCTARMRVTTLIHAGRARERFTLQRLERHEELDEPDDTVDDDGAPED